jgi:putative endonuclease
LLACPYVARDGEIDIVADDHGCLVFVEVKARRRDPHPEDAVTGPKRLRIERAAREYRQRYRPSGPYRFDILAVTVGPTGPMRFHLITDAFKASNTLVSGVENPEGARPDRREPGERW